MTTRRKISSSQVAAIAKALMKAGLSPSCLDMLPDGTLRWHFGDTLADEDAQLDQELRDFEAKQLLR